MSRLVKILVRRVWFNHNNYIKQNMCVHSSIPPKLQQCETSRSSYADSEQQESKGFQVTIIGLNPVSQSLSLLLKNHPLVCRLVLYDRPKCTFGVGLDLSHIPTLAVAEGQAGHIGAALQDADIVCLVCGELRRPGQTDYDLFRANTELLVHPVQEICRYCPNAFVIDMTEPINYTVPLISRVMQTAKVYDKRKILGVTGMNSLRAKARLHQLFDVSQPYSDIRVPVICGHSAGTAVPLLSHVRPWLHINSEASANIIEHVRESANSILQSGSHQASQLAAYVGAEAVSSVLTALSGTPDALIAFVAHDGYRTKYFASPIKLTKDGISEIVDFQVINNKEQAYLNESVQELACDIQEAESYYEDIKYKVTDIRHFTPNNYASV